MKPLMLCYYQSMKPIHMIAIFAAGCLLGGCSSPWQDHYTGAPIGRFEAVEQTHVREVPWQRIDDALYEIDINRASSDIHFDDWTRDEKLEEQASLLRGLQVSQDPRDVIVLGRSSFNSTDAISARDGGLRDFASSLGADFTIWASEFIGKADKVIQEPVYQHGYEWKSYRNSSGDYHHRYEPWHRTVYVPVVVQADEFAWLVYYIRLKNERHDFE